MDLFERIDTNSSPVACSFEFWKMSTLTWKL